MKVAYADWVRPAGGAVFKWKWRFEHGKAKPATRSLIITIVSKIHARVGYAAEVFTRYGSASFKVLSRKQQT
jgi:hypothetical protein